MDYCTLARVKASLRISETGDDTLLESYITRASRMVDRHCVGHPDSADYFEYESVADEILSAARNPLIESGGRLICYPHKPLVHAVSALAYRFDVSASWTAVDTDYITHSGYKVVAWINLRNYRGDPYHPLQVQVSYTGGYDAVDEGSPTHPFPADLEHVAERLTAWLYRQRDAPFSRAGNTFTGEYEVPVSLPVDVAADLAHFERLMAW